MILHQITADGRAVLPKTKNKCPYSLALLYLRRVDAAIRSLQHLSCLASMQERRMKTSATHKSGGRLDQGLLRQSVPRKGRRELKPIIMTERPTYKRRNCFKTVLAMCYFARLSVICVCLSGYAHALQKSRTRALGGS